MALQIISGDLLAAPEKYIGHQCNCVTKGNAAGLAKALFSRFPFADVYADRQKPSEPGTYSLHGDGKVERFVVNIYAQYYPGKPRKSDDTANYRLEWLTRALERFANEHSPSEIALPYGIGCGLAGGDWVSYQEVMTRFSVGPSIQVRLYKL